MKVSLTCRCGKVLVADAQHAGQIAACPVCGQLHTIPAAADPAPAPQVAPRKQPTAPPMVIPVDESEEEAIPEVDVEVHVPAWDEKKPPPLPKDGEQESPRKKKRQEDEAPTPEAEQEATAFATKLAAAENLGWAYVGALRLLNPATFLAYGPGGAWGLVDQDDDVLTLNMRKGKKIDRFQKHEYPVTCVALSPEGTYALTGDEAGDVIRWELTAHKRRTHLEEHESPVSALAFSRAGDLAASGDRRGGVFLWNFPKDSKRTLAESAWSERIASLAFSPDGKAVAAGGSKGRVEIWSVKSGRRLQRRRLGEAPIASLQFNAKGTKLIAAAKPGRADAAYHPAVYHMDVETGGAEECFAPTEAPDLIPHCTLLDHGGGRLLIAGQFAEGTGSIVKGDVRLEVWSIAPAQRLQVFSDLRGTVQQLAVTPANNRVAALLVKPLVQVFAIPGN